MRYRVSFFNVFKELAARFSSPDNVLSRWLLADLVDRSKLEYLGVIEHDQRAIAGGLLSQMFLIIAIKRGAPDRKDFSIGSCASLAPSIVKLVQGWNAPIGVHAATFSFDQLREKDDHKLVIVDRCSRKTRVLYYVYIYMLHIGKNSARYFRAYTRVCRFRDTCVRACVLEISRSTSSIAAID